MMAFSTFTAFCSCPLYGVCAVVRQYTEAQGGINLGKEQPNSGLLALHLAFNVVENSTFW